MTVSSTDDLRISPSGPFVANVARILDQGCLVLKARAVAVAFEAVWTYTAPLAGMLQVSPTLQVQNLDVAPIAVAAFVVVNGAPIALPSDPAGGANLPAIQIAGLAPSTGAPLPVAARFPVAAGDIVQVQLSFSALPGSMLDSLLQYQLTTH